MFNDLTSLTRYLATRRSARPRDMVAPGPSPDELRSIVAGAMRTPDHGKLSPWRVVHVPADRRQTLANALVTAYVAERPGAGRLEIEAMETFAHQAPELLVVLHCRRESSKIPAWEQELSTGAFTMNLLHAIHAHGYVGGWITGWPAFSDAVRDQFGSEPERLAGFVFIGTAGQALEERPRPMLQDVLSEWKPPS